METYNEKTASVAVDRCEYLGLQEDDQTALGFPSVWNYCHKARPAASVALSYQKVFCHAASHRECVLWQKVGGRRLPPDARSPGFKHATLNRRQVFGLFVLILTLFAGGSLAAWLFREGILQFHGSQVRVVLPTAGIEITGPSVISSPETPNTSSPASSSPAALQSTDPAALLTPGSTSRVCGYGLDETIHAERDFIVHRVASGENLDRYASEHGTSVEAILAVNHQLPVPLHVDWVLVIPVGVREAQGLPSFEPYFESRQGTGLEKIASMLGMDVPAIRYANGFSADCLTLSGWFLVPRSLEP